MPGPKGTYLAAVLAEVRWKRAHESIRRELSDHIDDEAAHNRLAGMGEKEALSAAVSEMGDADAVGAALDAAYRPKTPKRMFLYVGLLAALGIVLQFLIYGAYGSYVPAGGVFNNGIRTVLGWALGAGLFFAAYYGGGVRIARFAWHFFLLALTLAIVFSSFSVYTAILRLGSALGLNLYSASASSVLYLALPTALSLLLVRLRRYGWKGLLLATFAFLALLVAINVSMYRELFWFSYALFAVSVLYANRQGFYTGKGRVPAVALALLLPLLLFVLAMTKYWQFPGEFIKNLTRGFGEDWMTLRTLITPGDAFELEPWVEGWQLDPAIVPAAIKNARLFGPGYTVLNASVVILEGPYNPTDYLLTHVIYRYGWAAGLLLLAVPTSLLVTGYRRNARQSSPGGRVLGFAILSLFALQSLIYVLQNLGFHALNLLRSMPLPLLSYGNVSRVLNLALLGLLLALFRTEGLHEDAK